MTRYRQFNNNLKAAIPCIFAYDEIGNQLFDTTGAFHEWDTIKTKSSEFLFTADDDRIKLETNSSGLFMVEFDCSFLTYAEDDDLYITTAIYKNGTIESGGTSIITVTGGASQTSKIKNSQTIHFITYLNRGDYIQIKSTASANSVYSIADTSRIIITGIPMNGWDNNKAGREMYKGGVMR